MFTNIVITVILGTETYSVPLDSTDTSATRTCLLYLDVLCSYSEHVGTVRVVLGIVAVKDSVGDCYVVFTCVALCPQWRHHKEPLQDWQQGDYLFTSLPPSMCNKRSAATVTVTVFLI